MKKIFKNLVLSFMLTPCVCFAQNKSAVKILAWWNYIDRTWIKQEANKTCNALLSIQNYKDSSEFNRLISTNRYDIIIFESTSFKNLFPLLVKRQKESVHTSNISKYAPFVFRNYQTILSEKKIYIYFLADVVFLYNPKNIMLNTTDTLASIIKKLTASHSKYPLVILDDPNTLYEMTKDDLHEQLSISSFSKLFNYKNIIVSNDYTNYRNLGVFITWSGEALYHLKLAAKEGVKLSIVTIPRYAYTSSDLLGQISNTKSSNCVARLLSSANVMNKLQNSVFYYSPYNDLSSIKDPDYKNMYESFSNAGKKNQLKWVDSDEKPLDKIKKSWKQIILYYGL